MKIDVHAHLFSPAYIQSLQRIFGNDSTPVGQDAQRLIRWMNSDPRMIDVEGRLEEMTKWDIDMQVLSVPFHGAWSRMGWRPSSWHNWPTKQIGLTLSPEFLSRANKVIKEVPG